MFAGSNTGDVSKTFSNMENLEKVPDNKRKKLVIGGAIASLVLIIIVVIIVASSR
jgi:hypothetical protein